MNHRGLAILGSHGAGKGLVTRFGIPAGSERDAGLDVLALLAAGFEVSLRNDLDEGGEGCTLFRRSSGSIETKVGGHGWQGSWTPIDEANCLSEVAWLARLNRGGHWRTQGAFSRG